MRLRFESIHTCILKASGGNKRFLPFSINSSKAQTNTCNRHNIQEKIFFKIYIDVFHNIHEKHLCIKACTERSLLLLSRKVSYSLLNNVKDSPLLNPGKLTPHCSAVSHSLKTLVS